MFPFNRYTGPDSTISAEFADFAEELCGGWPAEQLDINLWRFLLGQGM